MKAANQYYCAPMFDAPLPKQVDLRKLAAREAEFNVKLDVQTMPRIADIVCQQKGFIDVSLQITVDEFRDRTIQGQAHCEVEVVCQRCLQPVAIAVDADVQLQIVWDEKQAEQLRGDIDPLIVAEDELVDLNELVEDELLLGFPLASHHADGECPSKHDYELPSEEAPVEDACEEKENPFSVLAQLKAGKQD